ncbi:hypothetical protein GOQ27_13935 [Clostridium sp. D2Q-11]|uniref:Uncharacterized protein n=1 Tax=Anaeromonas frigoriresistens TaxID=2683708 RepID=A0A942ZA89_9FIRM|nr:hypothetical protein [Anaeromonas frigoriresistens]MBS4539570.1 hypothetical protein [Anaeromonas frigoriresistens]
MKLYRFIGILGLLIVMVGLLECENLDVDQEVYTSTEDELVEIVKVLKQNKYEFKKLNITIDQFVENTKEIRPNGYED